MPNTTETTSSIELEMAIRELDSSAAVAQHKLVVYVADAIRAAISDAIIALDDTSLITEFLTGRSLRVAFGYSEEKRIHELAKRLYHSPDNLGKNVLVELSLERNLCMRYCKVGIPDVAMEKFIFLRGEFAT